MSKKQLLNTLSREIDFLNEKIDMKIVKGLSYQRDARRHQSLLATLERIAHQERRKKIFGFLSFS